MLPRVLLLAAILTFAAPAFGVATVGKPAPPLATRIETHRVDFSIDSARTKPLVLFFISRDQRRETRAWRDTLSVYSDSTDVLTIVGTAARQSRPSRSDRRRAAEVHGTQVPDRRVRRRERPNAASVPIIDRDGSIFRAWCGPIRSELVLVVVSTDNIVRTIQRGPMTQRSFRHVLRAIRDQTSTRGRPALRRRRIR